MLIYEALRLKSTLEWIEEEIYVIRITTSVQHRQVRFFWKKKKNRINNNFALIRAHLFLMGS